MPQPKKSVQRSPSKGPSQPRKRPRQHRSRETVRAILGATAQVLVRDGYEATTTNRVAEVAGVSIGSLYQYFPNKDALLGALLEAHLVEANAMRPVALSDGTDLSLRERVRLAVEWHLRLHAKEPRLHQILTTQAPRLIGEKQLESLRREGLRVIREALGPYRDELRPRDLDLAVFLYQQCLEAMTHGAVMHQPGRLRDPELLDEMTELLVAYLEKR